MDPPHGFDPRVDRSISLSMQIHMCMHMPSKNIAVQSQVYEALNRERRGSESFTGLFRRLLKERQSIEDLAGAWGASARPASARRGSSSSPRGSGGSR